MFSPTDLIRFPLWKFLKQPVFTANCQTVLNPHRFMLRHRVELLERCLTISCPPSDVRRD